MKIFLFIVLLKRTKIGSSGDKLQNGLYIIPLQKKYKIIDDKIIRL